MVDCCRHACAGYAPVVLREWWWRRRGLEPRHEAARRELRDAYAEELEAADPDGLESARDYGDHDLAPWRAEVGFGFALIVLMVSVVALIGLFSAIKYLTSGWGPLRWTAQRLEPFVRSLPLATHRPPDRAGNRTAAAPGAA